MTTNYIGLRQHLEDRLTQFGREMPGMVRVSFGLYNTTAEVDVLVEVLSRIVGGNYQGRYEQDSRSGEYQAIGWSPNLEQYFQR